VVMRIYLSGLCAAVVNRFNDIFTSFYARQWYDVTNDVSKRVEDVDRVIAEFPASGNNARFYTRKNI